MELQKYHTKSILKRFKKQFIIGIGIILIILLILVYSSPAKEPAPVKEVVDNVFSGVQNHTPGVAEVMKQHLNTFEANQQKINQQNAAKLAQLESENFMYKQASLEAESNAAKINERLAQLNTIKISESSSASKPKHISQKMVIEDDINNNGGDDFVPRMDGNNEGVNAFNEAGAIKVSSNANELNVDKDVKSSDNKAKDVATYIPSNSFVKGVLVSSLSANTGGNANNAPTPVLIRLTDLAQLPNEFRSNVKSCMVGGSGFGDLSTERVKIRLTTLSCVFKSGKAIDIPVNGYIAGEDAKAGIKGMVITHSGAIVAKSALAGFIDGLGKVGSAIGQTQTITPLGGVTTTIAPDQALYAGAGAGLSQVGSNLSQYYLAMLQQISPAIEVSAGRHITVIFNEGIELKLPINENVSIDEQSLPLNEG